MKKGIIIEMREKQKVILADNGRFYIVASREGEKIGERVTFSSARKKVFSFCLAVLISASAFYCGVFVVTSANLDVAESLVQVEINPAAEFLLNSKNKVLSVAPMNVEAALLLAGEKFTGMDIAEAVRRFVSLSVSAGFVNLYKVSGSYVYCLSGSVGKADSIYNDITRTVEKYYSENYMMGIVLREPSTFALDAQATMLGCGVSRLKASYTVYRIMKNNGETREFAEVISELNAKPAKELISTIRQAHRKYNQRLTPDIKAALIGGKEILLSEYYPVLQSYLQNPQNKVLYHMFAEGKDNYQFTPIEENEAIIYQPMYIEDAA